MTTEQILQGRRIVSQDIDAIRAWIQQHPHSSRSDLSRELCQRWGWQDETGRLKDMACRTLLLKLEKLGHIHLPPRRRPPVNHLRHQRFQELPHDKRLIEQPLSSLLPLCTEPVADRQEHALWKTLLRRYHYLGYSGSVGQNLKYLIRDCQARPLACLLFGAAAWSIAPRDAFIGWDATQRNNHLPLIANNMRFLILSWVRVPHLASHILAQIARRISTDWIAKYAHPIYLLETFVQRDRFAATCYRAANWIRVGSSQGRTRNDRFTTLQVPVKDIYLYPLHPQFRNYLRQETA